MPTFDASTSFDMLRPSVASLLNGEPFLHARGLFAGVDFSSTLFPLNTLYPSGAKGALANANGLMALPYEDHQLGLQ
eukprot:scaffold116347_cov17-Tisochrysis_lutea.AAC.1